MENITYEQVLALFAATDARIAKISAETSAEIKMQIDKINADSAARIAEIDKDSDARIAEIRTQIDKINKDSAARIAEIRTQIDKIKTYSDARIAEINAQTAKIHEEAAISEARSAALDARMEKTDKQIKAVSKQIADVTDSMGRFAEEQVRPKVDKLFRKKGIYLDEIYSRVAVKKEGVFQFEIDLLLVNTIYSVAVEVKHTLRQRDIDEHSARMDKLKKMSHRVIKGTTIYGAVAGMVVSAEVEKYAIKKGFYLIKPSGEGLKIGNKKGFEPKTW